MPNNEYIQISKRRYSLTEKGVIFVSNKLQAGDSFNKIGKEIGVNPDTLSRLCKEQGIHRDNRRKYSLNEGYFSSINSQESAYWLGFLSADGYISEDRGSITVRLQRDDIFHLVKFSKCIGSNKEPFNLTTTLKGKAYFSSQILINSRKMVSDLVELGCYQNKSLTLLPPKLEEKYIDAWILGYYDGDGGISSFEDNKRYKSYFTGTYEVLSYIKNHLSLNSSIRREHRCENNTFSIQLSEGPTNAMLERLYTEDLVDIALERKLKKFRDVYSPLVK